MVGNTCESRAAVNLCLLYMKTANIDAIQAKQGQQARKATRGFPISVFENFAEVQAFGQRLACFYTPVVKIASYDHRGFRRHHGFDASTESVELLASPAGKETEMHADTVQFAIPTGDRKFAMQQSALLDGVS